MSALQPYRRFAPGEQPDYLSPAYASTVKRSPSQPLIMLQQSLSEMTGPVFGHERVKPGDADLTRQHTGAPLGERIIVPDGFWMKMANRCATHWSSCGRPMPQAGISTKMIITMRRSIQTLPVPAAR